MPSTPFANRATPAASSVQPGATLPRREWVLLALLALGLAIGGYLSYVKLSNTSPVCIGDSSSCETVQNSVYAYLLGIPVAYLGFLSYLALAAFWMVKIRNWGHQGYWATLGFFGLALFGTIFSAYLTYVEFFILREICQWCVASALVITLLAVLSGIWLRSDLEQFEEE
jgi:uncharacterized membrane protein